MAHYRTGKFYGLLKQDLVDWVWNNPRLLHKISRRDLEYLFEFDPQRGLSIDLRRFEPEFYKTVFYPPHDKKEHIDEFVRKVCVVIHKRLSSSNRADLTITITVRHMVSEASHWKTFFMDVNFKPEKLSPLSQKEQDWCYSYQNRS